MILNSLAISASDVLIFIVSFFAIYLIGKIGTIFSLIYDEKYAVTEAFIAAFTVEKLFSARNNLLQIGVLAITAFSISVAYKISKQEIDLSKTQGITIVIVCMLIAFTLIRLKKY